MTKSQEDRLLRAALSFAETDAAVRYLRRDVVNGLSKNDPELRAAYLRVRRLAKLRLLRAAGCYRKQREMPLAPPIEIPKPDMVFAKKMSPGQRFK